MNCCLILLHMVWLIILHGVAYNMVVSEKIRPSDKYKGDNCTCAAERVEGCKRTQLMR